MQLPFVKSQIVRDAKDPEAHILDRVPPMQLRVQPQNDFLRQIVGGRRSAEKGHQVVDRQPQRLKNPCDLLLERLILAPQGKPFRFQAQFSRTVPTFLRPRVTACPSLRSYPDSLAR
jgi:hypothetical protein